MKYHLTQLEKISTKKLIFFLILAPFIFGLTVTVTAQTPQLSLADLVIALRSKKVTLPEHNKILAEAVKQRGITFAVTTDIEKELSTTGANPDLLAAIRVKSPTPKAAVETPKFSPAPVPVQAPPDFSFYQKRADERAGKGEFAAALADYGKAAEMRSNESSIFLGRGKTHLSMKSYELSIADFDKAIQLSPRSSAAYFNRALAHEKLGNVQKAMADYQVAADFDAGNEAARVNLKRLKDDAAASAAAVVAKEKEKATEPVKVPDFVSMGSLSAANAVRMASPMYSAIAQRARIEGRVLVVIELDENGNVTSSKAVSGPQMLRGAAEEAASKSKFKPAMFGTKPVKGKATVTYNFKL